MCRNLRPLLALACFFVFLTHAQLGIAAPLSLAEKWNLQKNQANEVIDETTNSDSFADTEFFPEFFTELFSDFFSDFFKDKHVLFVGGFGHDLLGSFAGYFKVAAEVAQNDFKMTTSISKTSTIWFSKNVDQIAKEIKTIYEVDHKKVILIGHSKGGGECLHVALRYPELIQNHILDRVILMQASVRGCAIVADEHLRFPVLVVKNFLNNFVDGFSFLNPYHADALLTDALQKCAIKLIPPPSGSNNAPKSTEDTQWSHFSRKVLYIPSGLHPEQQSYPVKAARLLFCWRHIDIDTELSDGLLPCNDQQDLRIGQHLGIMPADHLGLMVHPWLGGLPPLEQRAFFRALFLHLNEMN